MCAMWGMKGEPASLLWMESPVRLNCITKHAPHRAPMEREGVERVWVGGGGGEHHVFFIYVDCLNVSQARDVGVGVMEDANPEFQVVRERERERERGREREREGGRDRKEGGRAADTVQEMQCLPWKEGEGCGEGGGVTVWLEEQRFNLAPGQRREKKRTQKRGRSLLSSCKYPFTFFFFFFFTYFLFLSCSSHSCSYRASC